jgi:hypothetical protein
MLHLRDQRMGIDSDGKRKERSDLSGQAHPQGGVDTLKSKFPQADGAPAGVRGDGQSH